MSPRRETRGAWGQAAVGAAVFVAVLWALELVDTALSHRLDQYGVQPREDEGLLGILFAPLLHAGWGHLAANTVPVLVLLFLVLASGVLRGVQVTAIIWVVGGLGVWLVAPTHTVHLGASVLIFGWLVYLMIRGVFTRRLGEIALGVLLFLLYGGLLLGVLPGQVGISWQGHLFGAAGGALAAYLTSERKGT
ncbi:rhomboid family intramembrane serine protease [Nocardioides sp. cx-169]|uniref:rhomboid family intramembrane serine protease n=1 Tax=Nocardioides sp. cx-169 TaxID=2899080 RepID=UPI001E60E1A3|nr:rhomboid family intramembrane serine protease [Nocardioides sp. cx-169]MCD4533779.1 rhomboid family intramembrane serine protease [Nocardioides sp. cx-169]